MASDAEDGDEDDMASDAEDGDEDDSNEPLAVAASTRAEAEALYQQARAGVIHASAVEVNYMVCSSSDCGAHVIYESAEAIACPVCASALVEPEGETEAAAPVGTKTVVVDELANIDDSADASHEKLDVSYSSSVAGSPIWTAYYAGKPVAVARKSESGHQDIFDEATFGNAVLASARHAGVVNTLREMGFKAIANDVNLERYVEQQIEEQVAEERAAMASTQKQFQDRFKAALATASIGMTRGFFVGQTNPLKDNLFNALSSAGVRNPDVLLFNAFKSAADAYHNALFSKASEIMDKPVEVQEGLAKAVLEMNHTSMSATNPVEDRLVSMGVPATAAAVSHVPDDNLESVSSSDGGFGAKAAAVVSGLGRRIR